MRRSADGFSWKETTGRVDGLETVAAVSGTPETSILKEYNTIVIGTGFAGLIAARDLSLAGVSVLLVEGRDRIGGRTWTADVDGEKIEMGGTWVHWAQPHVFCELQRYGLDQFITSPVNGSNRLHIENAQGVKPNIITDVAKHDTELQQSMQRYFDIDGSGGKMTLPFPHNPSNSFEAMAEADTLSITDRVNQIPDLTSEQKTALVKEVAGPHSSSPHTAGFIEVLRWYALSNFEQSTMEATTMRYKIAKGTSQLALAIFDEFTGHAIFNQKVTEIEQVDDRCIVHTAMGKIFKARNVISTVPLNVAKTLKYTPPLPPLRQEALEKGHTCKGGKLHAFVHNNMPNGFTTAGCVPLPITFGWSDGVDSKDNTHLVLFTSEYAEMSDTAKTVAHVRKLHPEDFSVASLVGMDWNADEFAQGMWCMFEKGYFTKYWKELKKPHGRLSFASADTADGWRGFIDGAIEQGKRAAADVIKPRGTLRAQT
ncbi:putative flavin-containing amine oxidase [Rhexocercosporidium sp. MPI-PUGE-AT-0058]|nr:putative flavin-containing amine oxidase [Rhexocercosporidium sp. MPI-PUGE-AT-0058]